MKHMMIGLRKIWMAGKHVTINESMIAYMYQAVSFVQHMLVKLIKHGIKVYALCCVFSVILIAY